MEKNQATIMRWDVIQQLDTGDVFDITWITMDRRRGTGGEIRKKTNWAKVRGVVAEERVPGKGSAAPVAVSRNPHHAQHKTINIFNPSDPRDPVAKIHWRLITHFNGARVIG